MAQWGAKMNEKNTVRRAREKVKNQCCACNFAAPMALIADWNELDSLRQWESIITQTHTHTPIHRQNVKMTLQRMEMSVSSQIPFQTDTNELLINVKYLHRERCGWQYCWLQAPSRVILFCTIINKLFALMLEKIASGLRYRRMFFFFHRVHEAWRASKRQGRIQKPTKLQFSSFKCYYAASQVCACYKVLFFRTTIISYYIQVIFCLHDGENILNLTNMSQSTYTNHKNHWPAVHARDKRHVHVRTPTPKTK